MWWLNSPIVKSQSVPNKSTMELGPELKFESATLLLSATAGYVNKSKHGWGYYQANGKIGHAGPANVRYGEDFRSAGDTVEVSLLFELH